MFASHARPLSAARRGVAYRSAVRGMQLQINHRLPRKKSRQETYDDLHRDPDTVLLVVLFPTILGGILISQQQNSDKSLEIQERKARFGTLHDGDLKVLGVRLFRMEEIR